MSEQRWLWATGQATNSALVVLWHTAAMTQGSQWRAARAIDNERQLIYTTKATIDGDADDLAASRMRHAGAAGTAVAGTTQK